MITKLKAWLNRPRPMPTGKGVILALGTQTFLLAYSFLLVVF